MDCFLRHIPLSSLSPCHPYQTAWGLYTTCNNIFSSVFVFIYRTPFPTAILVSQQMIYQRRFEEKSRVLLRYVAEKSNIPFAISTISRCFIPRSDAYSESTEYRPLKVSNESYSVSRPRKTPFLRLSQHTGMVGGGDGRRKEPTSTRIKY